MSKFIELTHIPGNIRLFITDCRVEGLCIYAERIECFDKLSKCPIILPIPENREQEAFLVEKLRWLSTADGLDASNNYKIEKWVMKYPKDMISAIGSDTPENLSLSV